MRNLIFDQRTATFLVSLLIAFGLWLLIKLSGDFQTDNKVHLNFQNLPIDKILINKPDSVLQIRTNNNGFDVLGQVLFNNKAAIDINFSKAKYLHTKKGISKYFILCSTLREDIENQFKTAEQVLSIKPDSILFSFEKLGSKKIKIVPLLELSFNPRFKQYKEMQLYPDSILFFGPASLLKSISSINSRVFKIQDIKSNIDTIISLDLPSNKLISEQKNIKLKIAVEEYTEAKISLPIQIKGNTRRRYKIFPSEAEITYQVALKDFKKINPNSFELRVIPDSIELGKLNLQLSKQPPNVIVSNIQPTTAEYIILK